MLISAFLTLALIVFKTNNPIEKRYTDILNHTEKVTWSDDYKNNKNNDYNNLSLRLFLWHVGIDNIKEHNLWWTGAGNGSIYALQNKKMAEYGVMDMYNEKNRSPLYNVNLHNMYIQTLMMLGLPGLLVFLLIALLPFWYSRHSGYRTLFFIFNFIMITLMIQESSLQTQAGIVFYTFFSIAIYNYVCSERKEMQTEKKSIMPLEK